MTEDDSSSSALGVRAGSAMGDFSNGSRAGVVPEEMSVSTSSGDASELRFEACRISECWSGCCCAAIVGSAEGVVASAVPDS